MSLSGALLLIRRLRSCSRLHPMVAPVCTNLVWLVGAVLVIVIRQSSPSRVSPLLSGLGHKGGGTWTTRPWAGYT